MGELGFAVVLLAIALAIMGYDHLQQKQPEYPNKRLIAVFTLAGGVLSGLLGGFFAATFDGFQDDMGGWYGLIIIAAAIYGAVFGSLPAMLCGLALAWRRCTRSWKNVGFAAAVGGVSMLLMAVWAPFEVAVLAVLASSATAAILAAMALPKANKASEAA